MTHYADSSFLVSCYLLDAHTAAAAALLSRLQVPLPFNPLHALEVRNAFQLGVFRRLFGAPDAAAALANLRRDLRDHRLRPAEVNWTAVLRRAQRLSEHHSAALGTRSLDILHVAAARSARARHFLTFDSRQAALATRAGLTVLP